MTEQELNWTEVNPETKECGWDDLEGGYYVVKIRQNTCTAMVPRAVS